MIVSAPGHRATTILHIFVERSLTIERYCHPPHTQKKMEATAPAQFTFFQFSSSRARNYNCTITILKLQYSSVILKGLIYKCNLQASLNQRANACSCLNIYYWQHVFLLHCRTKGPLCGSRKEIAPNPKRFTTFSHTLLAFFNSLGEDRGRKLNEFLSRC
jgi:hypothetical protein